MKIAKLILLISCFGVLVGCVLAFGDTVEIGVRNKCDHQLMLMLNYSDGSRTDMLLRCGESLLLRAKRGATLGVIEVRRTEAELLYKYDASRDRPRDRVVWLDLTPHRAELGQQNTSGGLQN